MALDPKSERRAGKDAGLGPGGATLIGACEVFSAELLNDPVGHCTVGFGHLVHLGPADGSEPGGAEARHQP